MLGVSRRQLAAIVGLSLLGAATLASAFLWPRLGLAGLAVIATCSAIACLQIHLKVAALDRRVRKSVRVDRRGSTAALREQISQLEEDLAAAKHETARLDDLTIASFRLSIRQYIRVVRAEHSLKAPTPSAALQLPHKLRNLEFAASHGIEIPEVYQVWPDVSSITLGELPRKFVLKSDGGAGSVAVFPLERLAGGRYRMMNEGSVYDEQELKDKITSLGRRARAPYFAEELLYGADGSAIPDDVKCYMFYGEVGQILVRSVGKHGDPSTIKLKFVDQQGRDFGAVAVGRTHDPSIAIPSTLDTLASTAKHLSRAIGLPFCRVDLYDTSRGIVLGEITRAPSGGNEYFTEAHDEFLGNCWLRGSARLQADLNAGRPVGPLFGTKKDLSFYPPSDNARSPANLRRTVVECAAWCE